MLPDIIQVKTIFSQLVLGSPKICAKLTGLNLMPLFGFHFRFGAPRITSSEGEAGQGLVGFISLEKQIIRIKARLSFINWPSTALNSGDFFGLFVTAMFDQPCKLR